MKRISIVFAALLAVVVVHAEVFKVDTAHAEIGFSIKHMLVSNTKGNFNTFDGSLKYDIKSKTLKSVQGWIDVASIDTNNKGRDDHLREADFFNVAKFPKITFKSTSIKKTGDNTFLVTGKLNILGKNHKISAPITINGPVEARGGGTLIGIEGNLVLNRKTLGVGDAPAAVVGEEVKVSLNVEAIHK